ncbi:MAG: CocE/NonD family hydrolase [Rhodoferax sp.]|nr:CocE/NonD family hydrolase [Rhodoferax sp.]
MSLTLIEQRNLLAPMRDGVQLALDVVRPDGAARVPALLNFGPYHKDGRGGRLAVDSLHRHFAALGYAGVSADLRGLGNSGGVSPGPFHPGEAQDGHDLVEWIAAQPWCDGRVGMWGVSYPGITALATAATCPPHLKAIVPIHASSDLYRGVVGLGGTASGFWMRADWGPRMAAYNLMPPQWQDREGRWAQVWAEHLAGNTPWLEAFTAHPEDDEFWRSRRVDVTRIDCPTFNICGWRDLYADCTPLDHALIRAPKKLLMGPWKHEFPDTAREAPAAGLWEMQRWFDRWLKDEPNGIDREPAVSVYVQGTAARWRALPSWPAPQGGAAPGTEPGTATLYPGAGGDLEAAVAPAAESEHRYDPTIGMHSLAWDPWTTALDPALPHDHAADDARSLCFTGPALQAPLEIRGVPRAQLRLCASALPLNLVLKLSVVSPGGRSVLITSGWARLQDRLAAGEPACLTVALRATAYRLEAGERLRLAVACADFPRLWPTPLPAGLTLFHGPDSRLELPLASAAEGDPPVWGPRQPGALASAQDLGGGQTWAVSRDLMTDGVRLQAGRTERVRVDGGELLIEHAYSAAVSAGRPDQARMQSSTTVRLQQAAGHIDLQARTVSTARDTALSVDIALDGQPYWQRRWNGGG